MDDEWQQEDQEIDGADAGHSRNNSIATRLIDGVRGAAVYIAETVADKLLKLNDSIWSNESTTDSQPRVPTTITRDETA